MVERRSGEVGLGSTGYSAAVVGSIPAPGNVSVHAVALAAASSELYKGFLQWISEQISLDTILQGLFFVDKIYT